MDKKLRWMRSEIDYDLASAGWLAGHAHQELDGHVRHQLADICEGENRHLVSRFLGLAFAEVCRRLGNRVRVIAGDGCDNRLEEPAWYELVLTEGNVSPADLAYLKEQVHSYLVWRVFGIWCGTRLPAESRAAAENASSALAEAATALGRRSHFRRNIPPI